MSRSKRHAALRAKLQCQSKLKVKAPDNKPEQPVTVVSGAQPSEPEVHVSSKILRKRKKRERERASKREAAVAATANQDNSTTQQPAKRLPARGYRNADACIVHVDGHLLPGYVDDTVRRVGNSQSAGLFTRACCSYGPFMMPTVTIEVKIRDGNSLINVMTASFPASYFHETADVCTVLATDIATMDYLYPNQTTDVTGIRNNRQPDDYMTPFESAQPREEKVTVRCADQIQCVVDRIVKVAFDMDRDDAIFILSKHFFDNLSHHPPAVRRIGEEIRDAFLLPKKPLNVTLTLDCHDNLNTYWEGIQSSAEALGPFDDMLTFTRNGSADLTFDNINTAGFERPSKAPPSTKLFSTEEHRTVALIGGAVEDLERDDEAAEKLWNTVIPAIAVPDPSSKWTRTDQDLDVYGIPADDTCVRHFFFTPLEGIRDLVPDVGESVKMYLKVKSKHRELPVLPDMSFRQICKLADGIFRGLRDADRKGQNAEQSCRNQLAKLEEKSNPDEEKIDANQIELRSIANKHRTQAAAKFLFPYIDDIDDATRRALPDANDEQLRFHVAVLYANELARQEGEDDLGWIERIRTWVQEHDVTMPKQTTPKWGDPFHATRLPLPSGIRADVALYSVVTPNQSSWTPGFNRPPVIYRIPPTTIIGSLQKFAAGLFDSKIGPLNSQFEIKMWYYPNDTTIKAECAAVTALKSDDRDTDFDTDLRHTPIWVGRQTANQSATR